MATIKRPSLSEYIKEVARKEKYVTMYDNVVVMRLSVSCPSTSKVDNDLTNKLCTELKADTSAVNVRKRLINISEATKWRDKARSIMSSRGVPWSQRTRSGGKRDPMWAFYGRKIEEITDELRDCREHFFDEVHKMKRNYASILEDASKDLGAAYNPDDFMSAEDFERSFTWNLEVIPVMSLNDIEKDFRVKLPKEFAEKQIEVAKGKAKDQVANAVSNVMSRIVKDLAGDGSMTNKGLINSMIAFNQDPEDKRVGNTYRDVSVYDSIDSFREFASEVNAMFQGHKQLEDLIKKVDYFRTMVRPEDPALIRNDDEVRERVIEGLKEIVSAADPSKAKDGFSQFA